MADHIDYAAAYLVECFEDEDQEWVRDITKGLFEYLEARGYMVVRDAKQEWSAPVVKNPETAPYQGEGPWLEYVKALPGVRSRWVTDWVNEATPPRSPSGTPLCPYACDCSCCYGYPDGDCHCCMPEGKKCNCGHAHGPSRV